MAFQVATFVLQFRPQGEGFQRNGQYLGSAIRGAFGRSLRRTVCVVPRTACEDCVLNERCPYVYLFETPGRPSESSFDLQRAPHPFVICPPAPGASGEPVLPVRLVLMGEAIHYLPHVVWAFHTAGESGIGPGRVKLTLLRVLNESGPEAGPIWDRSEGVLSGGLHVQTLGEDSPPAERVGRVTLRFATPLRIRHERRLCTRLTFPVLMTNVLRRLYLLDQYHGDGTWQFDHRELIERAEGVRCTRYHLRWFDWTRYSSRQATRMQMGGLVGEVSFEGELGPFLPYLRAAERVHVGRNTSFGLGKMSIVEAL